MLPKHLLTAYLFYFFSWCFDAYVTTWGVFNNYNEGNPVARWLWGVFGWDNPFLYVGYFSLIFFLSYLLYLKISKFLGLLLLYSFGVGHILGFLSWTPIVFKSLDLALIDRAYSILGINGLFVLAPLIGAVLSFIHYKLITRD